MEVTGRLLLLLPMPAIVGERVIRIPAIEAEGVGPGEGVDDVSVMEVGEVVAEMEVDEGEEVATEVVVEMEGGEVEVVATEVVEEVLLGVGEVVVQADGV